jgi:hypothetical protein
MLNVSEEFLTELFTKKSHHSSIGVIFLTQNLFDKKIKVARNNSQYIVLMRSPSSALQIRNLGVQILPGQLDYFLDAYRKATAIPYGYLLIDLHPTSDQCLRLRTNIFKESEANKMIIYLPKYVK